MPTSRKMPSDLGGTRKKGSRSPISPADAKLNAAFKKAGFERGEDRAYSVPVIAKALNVWRQEKGYGQVTKPASMTKGSLVAKKRQLTTLGKNTSVPMSKLGVAKKAAPKKAAAKNSRATTTRRKSI